MVIKQTKLQTMILSGVSGFALVFNASAENQLKLELPPEKNQPALNSEPVPYSSPLPGEFRDVDLPDNLKKEKQLLQSANTNRLATTTPSSSTDKNFSIQVAMFKNRANAERYEKKLLQQHLRVYLVEKNNNNNQLRFHIRIGHFQNRQQAETVLNDFIQRSGMRAYIVSD